DNLPGRAAALVIPQNLHCAASHSASELFAFSTDTRSHSALMLRWRRIVIPTPPPHMKSVDEWLVWMTCWPGWFRYTLTLLFENSQPALPKISNGPSGSVATPMGAKPLACTR